MNAYDYSVYYKQMQINPFNKFPEAKNTMILLHAFKWLNDYHVHEPFHYLWAYAL